jgi:hypothetical protein
MNHVIVANRLAHNSPTIYYSPEDEFYRRWSIWGYAMPRGPVISTRWKSKRRVEIVLGEVGGSLITPPPTGLCPPS